MTIQPDTAQAIVDHDLFVWHRQILKELVEYGPSYTAGIACAVQSLTMDTARNLAQLETAGMVESHDRPEASPPGTWWEITDRGTDWATLGAGVGPNR